MTDLSRNSLDCYLTESGSSHGKRLHSVLLKSQYDDDIFDASPVRESKYHLEPDVYHVTTIDMSTRKDMLRSGHILANKTRPLVPKGAIFEHSDGRLFERLKEVIERIEFESGKEKLENKPSDEDREKFDTLCEQWMMETMFISDTNEIIMNKNHQRIIGMGERALPFIFENFEDSGWSWFWALSSITGQDPDEECNGDVEKTSLFWSKWGESKGYL